MTDTDEIRTQAFRLFEQQNYSACLDLIHSTPPRSVDTRIQILEAICLYSIGSLDEAEVCLHDLRRGVPDSAEVCLYLGKVLEQKGDERARAEYAEAVRLKPDHPEGIRRYAMFLSGSGDHRAAFCLFRRLVMLTDDPEDLAGLLECHYALGESEEGIARFQQAGSPVECFRIYLNMLLASEQYQELVEEIKTSPPNRYDHDITALYCEALTYVNPEQADQEFLIQLKRDPSSDLASRYVRFLLSQNFIREALGVWSTWLARSDIPEHQLQGAPLLELVSGPDKAIDLYLKVLFGEGNREIPDLSVWFTSFRNLIIRIKSYEAALDEVLTYVRPDLPPYIMIEIAHWCEEAGRYEDAKRIFLQAFRLDLTVGGLAYASYLGMNGEEREQKKILGYILKTVRKTKDLEAVAIGILAMPYPDPDLISSLNQRFQERIVLLSQHGRESYARCLALAAELDLQKGSPDRALEHSLQGLAIVPVDATTLAESLFALLVASKTQVLPDYLPSQICPTTKKPGPISESRLTLSWLDPGEEAIVEYLRKHRVCNEMDLRRVAGTRRVAGLMNRIMRKANEQGVHLAEKEGYSEFGEVYRYAGP